jgi:hypothetical protein
MLDENALKTGVSTENSDVSRIIEKARGMTVSPV